MRPVTYCVTVSMAFVVTLALILGMPDWVAIASDADAAAEIRALELAHNDAIARGDVATVARMTADDFTFITQRGFLIDREHMLSGLAHGAFAYEYRQLYDLKIRVYGDSAVVTGLSLHTEQLKNGKESSDANRYTRVYVRQNGRWLAVAWQTTVDDEDDWRRQLRKD